MRIMIVEDDPEVAEFMRAGLAKAGHEAVAYGHAGLAIGAIVRGKFELLICDLNLPNLDGIAAIKMIRSQFPYLPVVVVSGRDANEWEEKALNAGATCYMQKPLRLDRLLREVRLVEESRANLHVGIIDADATHAKRAAGNLEALGCTVSCWTSFAASQGDPQCHKLSVILVDVGTEDPARAIRWAAERGMAAVAIGDDAQIADQDRLLRLGASFCLAKPIDAEGLVIQSRFFVSPVPVEQSVN